MRGLSGSWRTVLAATAFNLLFEYSMRGVNNLSVQPILPIVLFTVYFTLYTMLEDLITRFRLKDYHLILIAFFYGTAYQFLVSGVAILSPLVFGVNWINLLFAVIVWWGALQSVLTFYMVNRVAPRDWGYRLPRVGWVTAFSLNALMILLFQHSGFIPRPSFAQLFTMATIMTVSALVLKISLLKKEGAPFPRSFNISTLLDILGLLTVGLFLICALFLTFDPVKIHTSNVNETAVKIVVMWTLILASALFIYRIFSRKSISV